MIPSKLHFTCFVSPSLINSTPEATPLVNNTLETWASVTTVRSGEESKGSTKAEFF